MPCRVALYKFYAELASFFVIIFKLMHLVAHVVLAAFAL